MFERNVKLEVLHQSFASIAKNELRVPHNELTVTVVRSTRIEVQVQKNRDNNISITDLDTEDDCIAACGVRKEIDATLMDTSFKVLRFRKDNKHVDIRFTDRKHEIDKL